MQRDKTFFEMLEKLINEDIKEVIVKSFLDTY